MFPRAAFWVLDRDGIKGHCGESQLKPPGADDEDEEEAEPEPPKGIGALDVPNRYIYCLDLRDFNSHQPYVDEVKRIAAECRERREAKQKADAKPVLVELGLASLSTSNGNGAPVNGTPAFQPEALLADTRRRWYPVIDYSRCTNCMECIDFCLFGVYGTDKLDRILVENQDNCKKGCPACSRVCPEQAIMFPDYKTAAIAGAPVGAIGSLKIDLTKLFGGDAKDAILQAASERDAELIKDGRDAVGLAVGIPKRQSGKAGGPKDELDQLVDKLDELDI
jgi:Pyruvate/2-oxoacid:ferredoxin oxidoreductase delta subunit